MSLALVECPGRTHQFSSHLVAEWSEKNKILLRLCLVGQFIQEANLGPNSRELAQSLGLKFGHKIVVNMYNAEWANLKAKIAFLIEFDQGQVGYSVGRAGHLNSLSGP